jgi:hypothetical protein
VPHSALLWIRVRTRLNPPLPLNKLDCYWWQQGKSWIGAKLVQLEILDPADQTTAVQHFNDSLLTPGMTKTSVSGVGDAAYYLAYANRIDLYVKKGSSVFYINIGNAAHY